ncbi:hypothetical protein Nepgr_022547 [Nepenthes gracilis]|uniref:Uncharacterized protein n=1 Tax=Nepenthes gracilis TaxID=150966 RepID=A0AAD3T2S4_NEPGR|nr:hypothetical protein Nepgr_022547 [Nepenthes gracilis]
MLDFCMLSLHPTLLKQYFCIPLPSLVPSRSSGLLSQSQFHQVPRPARAFGASAETIIGEDKMENFLDSGNDTVVAAETGSGETHGYVVPVLDKLFHAHTSLENAASGEHKSHLHWLALILCPNVMLCEQVACMTNRVSGDDGEPLLKAAALCGKQVGWSVKRPDVVVYGSSKLSLCD